MCECHIIFTWNNLETKFKLSSLFLAKFIKNIVIFQGFELIKSNCLSYRKPLKIKPFSFCRKKLIPSSVKMFNYATYKSFCFEKNNKVCVCLDLFHVSYLDAFYTVSLFQILTMIHTLRMVYWQTVLSAWRCNKIMQMSYFNKSRN